MPPWYGAGCVGLLPISKSSIRFDERGFFDRKRAKQFIELAIASSCYAQLSRDFRSEEIRRIVAFLDSVLERRDFHERVMRYPDEFVVTCDAYSALRVFRRDHLDVRLLNSAGD